MFDVLDRTVTARKVVLRQQADALLQRAQARVKRKYDVADSLEAARSAYRANQSDANELALHRALLRAKGI